MVLNLNHLGIIMDGNRRFAKRLMKMPWKGHEFGAKKIETVLDWCHEKNIKTVTLYALSLENLKTRPKKELDYLMEVFRNELKNKKFREKIHKNKIKVNAFGKLNLLPQDIEKSIKKLVEETKDYKDYELNFAIAYSGRQEILDAIKKISGKDIKTLDEKKFEKYLYTSGMKNPDLVIRTSGERRISGFLLWQAAYSEYYFIDKMWPELTKDDFLAALDDFASRQRRFGS
ncbi:MAG: di-trans,poly-cis-decaprenylcistransferase [Candidatus Aenigmarchaeota archaeon]|nr:di-trans,poly-cis-decaprenylcistransferase [Candidatus Aenigmarchaeota archaeon]